MKTPGSELEEYKALKEALDKRQREADKASGALEQTMRALKEEFQISSLGEAKTLLAKLSQEHEAAIEAFNKELAKLKEEFGHLL